MSFYRETPVKAVRKQRSCYGCSSPIAVGASALQCAGTGPDGFWHATYHTECRTAECALNDLKDYRFGDEWQGLFEIEWDDWEWLLAEHPIVAERMKITAEKLAEVTESHAARWRTTP